MGRRNKKVAHAVRRLPRVEARRIADEAAADLPPPSTAKKCAFILITYLGIAAVAEVGLWAAGVPTLIEREDPSRGFSGLLHVFSPEGPRYRTSAANRGKTFNDQSFLVRKPTDGLRLFCLGGSSSFGYPWGAEAAFTSIVGEALAAAHPDRSVEAVNASGVSYAMHRLAIVADELSAYDPDVFLVYEGHNEFVETAFYDSLKRRSQIRTRLEYALAHSRVYSGLRLAIDWLRTPRQAAAGELEARVSRDETHVRSPEEKEAIVAEFRGNLERLVARARAAGVKVVLATVPCNLRDWRPQASTGLASLSESDRLERANRFASGSRLLERDRFDAAVTDLEEAARLAPHHAETHFLLGRAYEGLGRFDEARSAYQRACDEDASPVRRLSSINAAIREVAERHGALLVDIDRVFEEQSPHGLVGFNLIEDYVHPTRQGHELIAWQIWDAMERAGWYGDAGPARREVFDRILAQRRPQTPEGNATWFCNQGMVLEKQGQLQAAETSYRRALDVLPDYSFATVRLGALLVTSGQFAEAATLLSRALQGSPADPWIHLQLGKALAGSGRSDEAVMHYRKALAIKPDDAEAHFHLGVALASRGLVEEAVAHYRQALERDRSHVEAHVNLGNALARRGLLDEAIEHYVAALGVRPDCLDAQYNLGLALKGRGRNDEAIVQFTKALEIAPDDLGTHYHLGLAFVDAGAKDDALTHYDKALELASSTGDGDLIADIRARIRQLRPESPATTVP